MKITFQKAVEILKNHEVFVFDETSPILKDFLTFDNSQITVDLGGFESEINEWDATNITIHDNRLEFCDNSDKIIATFDVYAPKNLI